MEFIKPDINIEFIAKRKVAYVVSGLLILITIVSLIVHGGPRYGVDFAGGTVIQAKFAAPVEISAWPTPRSSVSAKPGTTNS